MIRRNELHKKLRNYQATLIGRSFATGDAEDRDAFIDWLLETTDRLGLELKERR